MSLLVAACDTDSAGPEQDTSVEDVEEAEAAEGADLSGQTVTVSGEIDEILDPQGFTLGGQGLEEGVLVLSGAESFADIGLELDESLVDANRVLQVTGTVAELVIVDYEEEFGVDLDDTVYEDFEGEAVLVADQITTLTGETVTIAGQVTDVLSTVAFRMEGTGWTVVVLDAEQAAVEAGDTVQVTGMVRQFIPEELGEEFDVSLDDTAYTPYLGSLVLVAEEVTQAEVTEVE